MCRAVIILLAGLFAFASCVDTVDRSLSRRYEIEPEANRSAELEQRFQETLRVIEQNPYETGPRYWLGNYYIHEKRDYEAALEQFRTCARIEPRNPIPRFKMGEAYIFMKNYDDALLAFEKSVEIDPAFAPPYYSMSKIYETRGNRPLAEMYMAKYEKLKK